MTPGDTRQQEKTAELYRMATEEHICPLCLRGRRLGRAAGLRVTGREPDHDSNGTVDAHQAVSALEKHKPIRLVLP